MSMKLGRGSLFSALVLLCAVGCEEPAPPPVSHEMVKLQPPPPPKPVAAPPPARDAATLKWKPSAETRSGLAIDVRAEPAHRRIHMDLRPLDQDVVLDATMPEHLASFAFIKPAENADERDVLLVQASNGHTKFSGSGRMNGQRMKLHDASGPAHWVMTDFGGLVSDLDAQTQFAYLPIFELPPGLVRKGATWNPPIAGFQMSGPNWQETVHQVQARGTVTDLEPQPDGSMVAQLDLFRIEKLEGQVPTFGKPRKVSMTSTIKAHGEFLVAAGTWRSFHMDEEEHVTGLGTVDLVLHTDAHAADAPEPARRAALAWKK